MERSIKYSRTLLLEMSLRKPKRKAKAKGTKKTLKHARQ
jgi:hypothetical protein